MHAIHPPIFSLPLAAPQAEPVRQRLLVLPCAVGAQVEPSTISGLPTCRQCSVYQYSIFASDWTGDQDIDQATSACRNCPPNAFCPYGATVVPELGWWHSSPSSPEMHRCPQGDACQGRFVVPEALWQLPAYSGIRAAMQRPNTPDINAALAVCQSDFYRAADRAGDRQAMPRWSTCRVWADGFGDGGGGGPGSRRALASAWHLMRQLLQDSNGSSSVDGSNGTFPPSPSQLPLAVRLEAAALLAGYMVSQCSEGYDGNLCGRCEPGWYLDQDHQCNKCKSVAWSAVIGGWGGWVGVDGGRWNQGGTGRQLGAAQGWWDLDAVTLCS